MVPIHVSHQYVVDPPVEDNWTLAEVTLGELVEPLNFDRLENQDVPLMNIKLTFSTGKPQTVVGIVIARQLGESASKEITLAAEPQRPIFQSAADSYHLLEFTRTLSNHYQGVWLHAMTVFHIPDFPEQARGALARTSASSQRLSQFIFQPGFLSIADAIPAAMADMQQTQPISVRISALQISKIRNTARAQMGTRGAATSISRENAITGFIIAAINAHHLTPIRQIGHTLNVRLKLT